MNDYTYSFWEAEQLTKDAKEQLKEELIKDFKKLILRYELESNLENESYEYMLIYHGIVQGLMLAKNVVKNEGLTKEEYKQLEEIIAEESKKMMDKLWTERSDK